VQIQQLAEPSSFILATWDFSVTGHVPGIMPGPGIFRAVASEVFLFLSSKVFSVHLILLARNPESGRSLQVQEVKPAATGSGQSPCH
jgi:hypothetical protein